MGSIPNGFKRELNIIDPEMFVEHDGEANTYDVYKIFNFMRVEKGEQRIVPWKKMVESFTYLNDTALTQLRYRKYLGRKFDIEGNPEAYIRWLKREENEAKAKKTELAIEMMAEGFMKMHRMATSKTFT